MVNLNRLPSTAVTPGYAAVYDGNLATAYSDSFPNPPSSDSRTASITWTYSPTTRLVQQMAYKCSIYVTVTTGASYNGGNWSFYIYLHYTSGNVYLVSEAGASPPGGGLVVPPNNSQYAVYTTMDGSWDKAEYMVLYAYVFGQRGCGGAQGGSETGGFSLYEVEAWAKNVGGYAQII